MSGLVLPAYFHPLEAPEQWRAVRRLAPRLRCVVLNVANGPGPAAAVDPAYVALVRELRAAQVPVAGYLDVAYGVAELENLWVDVARWRTAYGVNSLFLDRFPVRPPDDLARTVLALREAGADLLVANPGLHPVREVMDLVDVCVTFEGTAEQYERLEVPRWARRAGPDRIAHLVYGVAAGRQQSTVARAAQLGATAYVTERGGLNPWSGVAASLRAEHRRHGTGTASSPATERNLMPPTVPSRRTRPGARRAIAGVSIAALSLGTLLQVPDASAATAAPTVALRVLVVDDGSTMVNGLSSQLDIEGVPHTTVSLTDPSRSTITSDFLASATQGNFQAVILPQSDGASWMSGVPGLSTGEVSALQSYEAAYGVRQVDAFEVPGPQVGLQSYAGTAGQYAGALDGQTATVTPAGAHAGWSYLSGSVPFGVGSYGIVTSALTSATTPALAAGASFTPLVTVSLPGGGSGPILGQYSSNGVDQLALNATFSTYLQQFRMLAHGIVTWATRGVHFGYNRNYYSQHFDDAFGYDTAWNATAKCTPGSDCPPSANLPITQIRMTAADVDHLASWQTANDYQPTLAFNAFNTQYDSDGVAWTSPDPLTTEFVRLRSSFRWLNHGYQHIFQGCQQNFTVLPWACVTTDGAPVAADGSNLAWVSTSDISNEISVNVARGIALGLPFDQTEYLSGEHSGLSILPQQPVDNPNFLTALGQNGIKYIGADASRGAAQRQVAGVLTVPRHPVAIYYNVATQADEVSEYNYIYLSATQGGSGYCDNNPATATCLAAPLDPATGFQSYILPTDVANDLRFILSNDPRPFYAHVSNLTGDYLGLSLMSAILSGYRTVFAPNAPLVNLTLTQAGQVLKNQSDWAAAGMPTSSPITGSVQNGVVTISNPTGVAAPLTVPTGTQVNGASFGTAYGGESSDWIAGNLVANAPVPTFTTASTAAFRVGASTQFTVAATNSISIGATGQLPTGITFTDNGNGTATIAGTPASGTGGTYPLSLTASNIVGSATQSFTLTVGDTPTFTSAASTAFVVGVPTTFTVTTTGYPRPAITETGTLPPGVTFTDNGNGTGALTGTVSSTANRSYSVLLAATNALGTATQNLTIQVYRPPVITSSSTLAVTIGKPFSFAIRASGNPTPVVTVTGALPAGVLLSTGNNGYPVLSGTPAPGTAGIYLLTVTAVNSVGTATQTLTLTVRQLPSITSAATATFPHGVTFAFTVTTTGYPTPRLSTTTTLPTGVRFIDNGDGTGTLSGGVATPGTYQIGLRARNSAGTTNQAFSLVIS